MSLTKLCPHVVKCVILLLNLFALHSVNDNLSLIVRSTNNKDNIFLMLNLLTSLEYPPYFVWLSCLVLLLFALSEKDQECIPSNSKLKLTKVPAQNHQLATASGTLLTVAFLDMSTFAKFQFCCSTIITFTFNRNLAYLSQFSLNINIPRHFHIPASNNPINMNHSDECLNFPNQWSSITVITGKAASDPLKVCVWGKSDTGHW